MIIRILIFLAFLFLIEFLALRAILKLPKEKGTKRKIIRYYLTFSGLLMLATLVYYFFNQHAGIVDHIQFRRFFNLSALLILNLAPKIIISISSIIDDIIQLLLFILKSIFQKKIKKFYFRRCILYTGFLLSLILEGTLIYGIGFGNSEIVINRINITNPKVPDSFDGFSIAHISDFHLGSFKDTKLIEEAVLLLQSEDPDAIMFTGDLVNNEADEVKPFIPIMSKLKPTNGMFSILGNHDMGDYRRWYNDREKQCNLQKLVFLQNEMGFTVLRNQHTYIVKNNDSIAVIGIDNWGEPPFKKYGDLNKASEDLDTSKFSILLSHDPSHWKNEVITTSNIALTLSGHTHGFQFAVKLGNYTFSPVQFKYKEWGGLYKEKEQYLYVNTGLGFIGFPGRVGVKPEITVITLNNDPN